VKTIDVSVIGNRLHQLNRQLKLRLSNPVELILGTPEATGEIEDDDPAPAVAVSDAAVIEGNGGAAGALFTVTLAEASGKTEMVSYATADGTATAGSDYTAVTGTLTFAPGEITKTVTVPVIGDTLTESAETFTLTLTRGSDAPLAKAQGIATITDDDLLLEAWTTTTAAEFSAGSLIPGAVVTNTEGGELTLAAPTQFDLLGTALPAGWTGSSVKGGSFSVANGWLTADGATISSPLYGTNTIAEFSVTFAQGTTALVGVANQFAGFSNGQFITKTDGKLYARTTTMNGTFETPVPMPLYGVAQRFAIRWTGTSTDYFLNGVQIASHTGSAMMAQMNLRFGDSTAGGAKLLVDWVSIGATTGTYVSRAYDAGQAVSWTGAFVTTQLPLPLSASVTSTLRTSNDGVTWTAWTTPAAVALAGPSRYVQYRLDLTMTSPSNGAPIVKDVAINYERR
jgi:hypothetical protein